MNTQNQKTYTFQVKGLHCNSCVILTESELKDLPGVISVKTSLKENNLEIVGEFGDKIPEQIINDLNEKLKVHGYSLSLEKQIKQIDWSDFKIAVPIALVFVALFITLQKMGIINLITASEVSYGTAFIIGLIASVSTCMAVVGGLVLSISANFAKEGDKVRPQILFHLGRLVSFFLLGGVIGILGSSFELGGTGTFILSFFLPCGFTQSMQIYALSTGSFWTGALVMSSFALGTLPVLALLSFSSLGIHKKAQSGIFFKTAELVVIFFGIFNLINSLAIAGIIPPVFNF